MSDHPLAPSASAIAALYPLFERAQEYAGRARAARTLDAYDKQWRAFCGWCELSGLRPLPASPETLALYLTARAQDGRAVATLVQGVSAIVQAHKLAGHRSPSTPAVREVLRGIQRVHGRPQKQKKPLLGADVQAMLQRQPDSTIGLRNRALLLVGFLGGFRRAELVAICVEHVTVTPEGLLVQLFGNKDDKHFRGRKVPIARGSDPALCPVLALEAWLSASGLHAGPVFRSVSRHGQVGRPLAGRDVAVILKRLARDAGLDARNIAAHSLRAGFVTAAHQRGATIPAIMKVTGHRSYDTALKYIREADLFAELPSRNLF